MADVGFGVSIIDNARSGRPRWLSSGHVAQIRKASAKRSENLATGFKDLM